MPLVKQAEEEQAAQVYHDRQVQLQEMEIKRLDLLIQLEEKKIIAAKEEHEYQLKIKSLEHELQSVLKDGEIVLHLTFTISRVSWFILRRGDRIVCRKYRKAKTR